MKEVDFTPVPGDVCEEMAKVFPNRRDVAAAFFFSMAKCGSTMLTNAVEHIATEMELPKFHFSRFFWQRSESKRVWWKYDMRDWVTDGVIYYGFRDFPDFVAASKLVQKRRSIFLVRDPRDAVTSHYFSKLYEHPVPGGGKGEVARNYVAARERMKKIGIDEHVVNYAKSFLSHWSRYMDSLPISSGVSKIFRYEDIIYNKFDFLSDAFDHVGIPVPADVVRRAVEKVDIFPEREQVNKRARSVTPGNHREKLRPDTIEKLDAILAKPLTYHGYI